MLQIHKLIFWKSKSFWNKTEKNNSKSSRTARTCWIYNHSHTIFWTLNSEKQLHETLFTSLASRQSNDARSVYTLSKARNWFEPTSKCCPKRHCLCSIEHGVKRLQLKRVAWKTLRKCIHAVVGFQACKVKCSIFSPFFSDTKEAQSYGDSNMNQGQLTHSQLRLALTGSAAKAETGVSQFKWESD